MRSPVILVCALLLATSGFAKVKSKSRWEFSTSYQGAYESNIYHAYADSIQTSAFLNQLAADLNWQLRLTPRLSQRVTVSTDLDAYPSYSNRNRSSLGFAYEPTYRYAKNGRVGGEVSVGRRNKDLIDDTGTLQSRTLKRWESTFGLWNRVELFGVRFDQSFTYQGENYDEEPGLTSYDYISRDVQVGAHVPMGDRVELRAEFASERRTYDKRRTYTVRYGAFVNRPFEIRSFRENSTLIAGTCQFWRKNEVGVTLQYIDRNDNFENFYGYMQRRYQIDLKLYPGGRHQTRISFEFKNKDYPNYWNSSIGRLNRVHIDYADFQFEHRYQLSDLVTLVGHLRNYHKQSNYWVYDYLDLTGGIGLDLRF